MFKEMLEFGVWNRRLK